MLTIIIPSRELYDESENLFFMTKEQTLQLEHSLVSISKWESKWHKPFYSQEQKTQEETLDYVRCMTITQNVSPETYRYLTKTNLEDIFKYIDSPMTATTFSDRNTKPGKRDIITSEVIYYWMISLNIPMECQKWHINRLLALIKVCDIKNKPPEKLSQKEIIAQNRALNEQRRKRLHTKG